MTLDDTLKQRGGTHGDFTDGAEVSQALKEIVFTSKNAAMFTPVMCEALDMILHKIARICVGNPTHADSWHDIQGYARLVEERLSPPAGLTND